MSDEGKGGRRRAGGRGRVRAVLGTLVTASLVVAAGFAIGVVAGLALEDASLVKDYVTGDPREIAREGDADAPTPLPADPGVRPPALDRAGFSVQVGAFADAEAARELAEDLEGAGYPVYVAAPDGAAETQRWRVRVGPVSTRDRAERVARELKSERALPTWVLDESAS